MTANLSRLLNSLGLVAIDTVLVLAFTDQLWFRDLPCPICILQRAGFIAAGFGIALNLIFGPRASSLRARDPWRRGRAASCRRDRCCSTSSHSSAPTATPCSGCTSIPGPASRSWRSSWAAPSCFYSTPVRGRRVLPARLKVLPVLPLPCSGLSRWQCDLDARHLRVGVACPENPSGYLIFNDNLSLTLLGNTP